ncbi:uncharacterized protein LOC109721412 [Ananas comosus]|uniref:Uncharacterized protein LOC109721412 n=1 Tax=Ananas comosus TaxID=4615 RepID=A0A6P5GH23_ANACO|nr:uncharacterized protein LOC109721412 [Ananas comosus]
MGDVRPTCGGEWPGLPRGVKFDPSDDDLLWHLLAKVGNGKACPHPFIGDFIKSLDKEEGFGYMHPQKLPGIKHDGSASYYFHRTMKSHNTDCQKLLRIHCEDAMDVMWCKIGRTEPVIMDGSHEGFRKVFVLYISTAKGEKPEKTNWMMHQYHLGTIEEDEGEFVVSKLFYCRRSTKGGKRKDRLRQKTIEMLAQEVSTSHSDVTATGPLVIYHANVVSEGNILQVAQEGGKSKDNDCDYEQKSSHNHVLNSIQLDHAGALRSEPATDDLDSINLLDRYNMLVSSRNLCSKNLDGWSRCDIMATGPSEVGHADVTAEQNISQVAQECHKSINNPCDYEEISPQGEGLNCIPVDHARELASEPVINDLDHISLQQRYNMLVSSRTSCSNDLGTSRCVEDCDLRAPKDSPLEILDGEACGSIPRSESYGMNHMKAESGQDIFDLMQDIVSGPPIVDNIGECCLENIQDVDHLPERELSSREWLSDCVNESEAANSAKNLILSSPNSVITGNNSIVDQFSPNPANCQNNTSSKNSPFQHLSTEVVNFKFDDASKGSEITESQEEARNDECQNQAYTPNAKPSSLSHKVSVQNEKGQISVSALAMFPVDVKSEPLSEGENIDTMRNEGNCRLSLLNGHSSKSLAGSEDVFLNINASNGERSIIPSDDSLAIPTAFVPEIVSTDANDKILELKVKSEPVESELSEISKKIPINISESDSAGAVVKSENSDEDLTGHIHSVDFLDSENGKNMNHQSLPKAAIDLNDTVYTNASHSYRRKRKRTATDSLETALEEDAPGLLKVLIERGITVEEIKLYGDAEDDDLLEISSSESDFEELETVITKLFSARESLLKFSTARHTKGSKAVYCLACLISLIEQTRYLRFRNSPVEWGWCRDLQSFIFVFKSHNRIVLERPEYGYATYFFEIVESLPIDWQIKRLVIAMKLTSCSRTTLIENKPLLVGEDLTEGEARVLEEYGWVRNSGLGTMLNYCDRVVHDKRNERYSSDWRAKIGRLLMNGYEGGRIVLTELPSKVVNKFTVDQSPEIKLEDQL